MAVGWLSTSRANAANCRNWAKMSVIESVAVDQWILVDTADLLQEGISC
jgi:hypothetical protein